MSVLHGVVLLVALQRLAELALARRNTARLRALGGIEHGAGHYPLMVALHGGWLAALWFLVPAEAAANWVLLGLYGGLQVVRLGIIRALGERWTTRIITVPGRPLVESGPYRFCRHPNYMVVAVEIALLPLAFGAWRIALVFSLLNAALLAHRIRVENAALAAARTG